MAEFIGLAASGVQLAGVVPKSKRVYEALRDALTDFKELEKEVSYSKKLFEKSRQYLELLPQDGLVAECMRDLQQAQLAIDAVSGKMSKAFDRHPKLGSLRFVWNSSQVQRLRKNLEQAQKLMDRTQQLIHFYECASQFSELQKLLSRVEHLTQHVENGDLVVRSISAQQIQSTPPNPQHRLEPVHRVLLTNRRCASRNRAYTVVFPQWLWSKALRLALEQQQSLFGISLRFYNIVSWDSPIFLAVRNGDINEVKQLFEKGASPLDILSSGQSLLSTATYYCHTDICQFLINQRAEISYVDHSGKSALHHLAKAFVFDPDLCHGKYYRYYKMYTQTITELLQLLSELVPDNEYDWKDLEAEFPMDLAYLPSMRFLLKRGFSDVQLLSQKDRVEMIMETDSLDVINDLLGSDLSPLEAFVYAKNHRLSYRRHLEYFLAKDDQERDPWSSFIKGLLAADRSLVVEDFPYQLNAATSVVGISLYHTASLSNGHDLFSGLPNLSNKYLRTDLVTLRDLGADLEVLGQTEQYIFHRFGWCERYWDPQRSFGFRWRMTGLTTGPDIDDWKIWLAPDDWEYEFAGQFWHGIENPELHMPGAFIEEDI